MLKYNKYGARIFFAPPNDPAGAPGNPAANQGGHQGGGAGGAAPNADDPFSKIDFDDLPPEIKTQLISAKEKFATLQTSSQQSAQQLEAAQRQARDFQSRHDKLAADVQRLTGGQNPQQTQNPQEVLVKQIEDILIKRGVTPEQAKLQAPIHADLLAVRDETLKREIGTGLQPVIGSMLQQQANSAWQQVAANDRLNALQVPEVAQATWDGVLHLLSTGQQVTPEVVANLKNMHYSAHLEANPAFQTGAPTLTQQPPMNQPPNQPTYPNTATRFSFPGAGSFVTPPTQHDPNAARTTLNAETHAALAATFARMGSIQPKAFKK